MRNALLALLCAAPLLLTACSSPEARNPVTMTPSTAELPQIPGVQRNIPAVVAAERDPRAARVPLAPSFEEPPLTPEEELALDDGRPDFKFLPYNVTFLDPNATRGPDRGGVTTAESGTGGAGTRVAPPDNALAAASTLLGDSGNGGVGTGVDRSPVRRAGYLPSERSRVESGGPRGGVRVGEDYRDRRVAQRKPWIEN